MSERLSTFLYRIQPARPELLTQGTTPAEEKVIKEHFSYLEKLTDKAIVLLAGRTLNGDPSSFGIVILNAKSEAEARQIMLADPAVSNGVMQAELFPFRIALCGPSICEEE